MRKILTIAGSDPCGGAGIQADLKTFAAHRCYGLSAITAVTIQNTLGVKSYYPLPAEQVTAQLDCIFEDMVPDAIKIGMLANCQIIHAVCNFLQKNALSIPIVIDPVMVSSSGFKLLDDEGIGSLKTRLLPLATLFTPNLAEASVLYGKKISTLKQMKLAALSIINLGANAVLLKGGHINNDYSPDLLLMRNSAPIWLNSKRIVTSNDHGTGCTLSANLAKGFDLTSACHNAKHYLTLALESAINLNFSKGKGSLNHFYE